MGIINCLEDYDVEMFEYAHLTEQTGHTAWNFRLYIPKVMATFPLAAPKHTNLVFNNNIFLNDASCKPATGRNLTTQNFVTVMRFSGRDFGVAADKYGWLYQGQRFIVQLMDRNIKDMRIAEII